MKSIIVLLLFFFIAQSVYSLNQTIETSGCEIFFSSAKTDNCGVYGGKNLMEYIPKHDQEITHIDFGSGGSASIFDHWGQITTSIYETENGLLLSPKILLRKGQQYYITVDAKKCSYTMDFLEYEDSKGYLNVLEHTCTDGDCIMGIKLRGETCSQKNCVNCNTCSNCKLQKQSNPFNPQKNFERIIFIILTLLILLSFFVFFHIGRKQGKKDAVKLIVDFQKTGKSGG